MKLKMLNAKDVVTTLVDQVLQGVAQYDSATQYDSYPHL